jgi:hypothetical protein
MSEGFNLQRNTNTRYKQEEFCGALHEVTFLPCVVTNEGGAYRLSIDSISLGLLEDPFPNVESNGKITAVANSNLNVTFHNKKFPT